MFNVHWFLCLLVFFNTLPIRRHCLADFRPRGGLIRLVPAGDAVHSPPHSRQINNSQLHRLNDSDSSLELTGTFTTSEEFRINPAMAAAVSAPRDAAAAGADGGGGVGAGGAGDLSRPAAGGAGEAEPSGGDADVDDRYVVLRGLLLCRPWIKFQSHAQVL